MAVDRKITGIPEAFPEIEPDSQELLIDIPADQAAEDDVSLIEEDDGGVIVDFAPQSTQNPSSDFYANLADELSNSDLSGLSGELISGYSDDKNSRKEWEQTYISGLDLLGFKYEEREQPFRGATGITHPLLAESVTQFQAQAYKELLPSGGPVRTQIVGAITADKEDQSQRVKSFMNYQITEVMEEYDPDMDQLLFYLPLSGSAFKKVYYDEALQRAVSKFVTSEDLIIPYTATDLMSTERITHIVHMQTNDLRKLQVNGFYRDITLTEESGSTTSDVQSKLDELQGGQPTSNNKEYLLLEFHVDLDLPGFEDASQDGEQTGVKLPYIVTVDEGSSNVLSIRRNWNQPDSLRRKKQYFVHYKFLPGLGFYGFGLIHMIGGLSRSATSVLRQLIDAGTLANLPAGFKARGMRIRDDDEPHSLLPLPYKEPSATLFQLLGLIIESGRRFSAIADLPIADSGLTREMPVGTTMALLERGTKVMSGIHKRLHYAQRLEFRLLSKVFTEYLPEEYPYEIVGGQQNIKLTDFDDRIDIIPVSDPNIFSSSQRIMLAQTQLQLAQAAPEMHNLYEAYHRMYDALGVKEVDVVLPPPPVPAPTDPAEENRNSLSGMALQAFMEQNHDAHIAAHMAFMRTPIVMAAPVVVGGLTGHISQHIGMKARGLVIQELGPILEQAQAQGTDQLSPQDQQQLLSEAEGRISEVIAQITAELMEGSDTQEDPLVELRKEELRLQEADMYRKSQEHLDKHSLDEREASERTSVARERIDSQEDIAEMRSRIAVKRMQQDKTKQ